MEKLKVKVGTIIRTIALIVTFANQILAIFGKSPIPFDSEVVEMVTSSILTGLAAIWAWWKNNSFTQAAIKADQTLKSLKGK